MPVPVGTTRPNIAASWGGALLPMRFAPNLRHTCQDLNDSMVTLSKVFREPVMAGLMEQRAPDLLDTLGEDLPTC